MGPLIEQQVHRPPLDVGEAARMIVMNLHVTSIEPPGPDDGQGLPVVHFKGISRSLDDDWDDDGNSSLRGIISLLLCYYAVQMGGKLTLIHWPLKVAFDLHERAR